MSLICLLFCMILLAGVPAAAKDRKNQKKMEQLFSRRQTRGANVATFLALLELVRGGRVTLGPEGELKMRRGRIDRTKEEQ